MAQHVNFSKFATADAPTVQVPMSVINRPLPSQLDQSKVERFMEDIKVRVLLLFRSLGRTDRCSFFPVE